ncbi:DUF4365 domain-containing protein [Bacillus paranthracis]|uniref:DUF4365 domain-containing protein n=1 Tax=Bacillus paranthracis TaxID=2026186 RepID=UPI0009433416
MENIEYIRKVIKEGNKEKITKKLNENVAKGMLGEISIGNYFFQHFGWGFHPTEKLFDFGIDGFVEVIVDNIPTAKMFAVQVKKGTSHLKDSENGNFIFSFSEADFNYWKEHTLPVILIFDNEKDGKYYWVQFNENKVNIKSRNTDPREIIVPKDNIFSRDTAYEKILNIASKPNFIANSILQLEKSMHIITTLLPYHFARCRKSEVRRIGDYVIFNLECYNERGEYKYEEILFMQYDKKLNQKEHVEQFEGIIVADKSPVPIEDNPFYEDQLGPGDEYVDGDAHQDEEVDDEEADSSTDMSEEKNAYELWDNDLNQDEFYMYLSDFAKIYPEVSKHLFGLGPIVTQHR